VKPGSIRPCFIFQYWRGYEYQPGDKYEVIEDHTFNAVWKPETPNIPPKTGD